MEVEQQEGLSRYPSGSMITACSAMGWGTWRAPHPAREESTTALSEKTRGEPALGSVHTHTEQGVAELQ